MSKTLLLDPPHSTPNVPAPCDLGSCEVSLLDDARRGDWSRFVEDHGESTLFHTLAWRDAIAASFPHQAFYLTATRSQRLVGVLPMFLVKSKLAGRLLVSVPYGVGGGALGEDDWVTALLLAEAKRIAQEQACVAIDLRSDRATAQDWTNVDRYVKFERELPERVEDVLGWLPRKARAAARNARNKHSLSVSFDDGHLETVWNLYTLSMRRLGSLAYSLRFFKELIAKTPGRHWVSLITWQGRPVAGLVTFTFKDRVMPYFIGTTDQAKQCSAANFAYLTLMERGVEQGFRVFDFGRSRRGNKGSFDFKRFNGFAPRPLEYQRYVPPGCAAPNLSPDSSRFRLARKIWTKLPLFTTRILGAQLSKHIPG